MDFLSSLLDFGLNVFGKSGGIPTTASGVSLLGSLLYAQYAKEARQILWDTFLDDSLEAGERAYNEYMAEKLDMTPEEFQEFHDSNYKESLDEVARWKKDHPDPMDILVDMVMEQTRGK